MLDWDKLVEIFKRVTNLPAVYKDVPMARDVPTGLTYGENGRAYGGVYIMMIS
jgi:hypothetical protein